MGRFATAKPELRPGRSPLALVLAGLLADSPAGRETTARPRAVPEPISLHSSDGPLRSD
jgi:hypothetical protein